LRRHNIWKHWDRFDIIPFPPWFFSNDWWMYQANDRHTGQVAGFSDIRSTTVEGLYQLAAIPVDGPVVTKPAIVDGKIYVGTGRLSGGSGGTIYKIDLSTGTIVGQFPTPFGMPYYTWYQGIGALSSSRRRPGLFHQCAWQGVLR
jgi:outer membrane protein assembly factor BamB